MTDPADGERRASGVPTGDAASHDEQPAEPGSDASLPQRTDSDAREVEP